MDPSSSVFGNYDIEIVKRRIKCDSILFLVLFFIPIAIACCIENKEAAIEVIFWFALYYSPYGLTGTFGFFTVQNEKSYINCYSGFLKCTFVYCALSIGISTVTFFFMLIGTLTSHCDPSKEERCGFVEGILILVVILSFLYLVYSSFGFILWWFANKHANTLKDLILRRAENFQNPFMTGGITTNSQFMPVPGIPVGSSPQYYPQYNPGSYEMH
ncbi:unnamed protein product [Blepharisma stoltei]|uniref:Uncharacterized protein n=1 Tax=Blepharisma stoltei TaxID=1481888 RepID=A0AAU9J0W2_9CILI|nr:unnamed protein product [Blepharisma stoltei]